MSTVWQWSEPHRDYYIHNWNPAQNKWDIYWAKNYIGRPSPESWVCVECSTRITNPSSIVCSTCGSKRGEDSGAEEEYEEARREYEEAHGEYEKERKEYEEEQRKFEEELRKYEEELSKSEEMQRKYEEEQRKFEEEQRQFEEEQREYEEEQRKFEEEQSRFEEEYEKAERECEELEGQDGREARRKGLAEQQLGKEEEYELHHDQDRPYTPSSNSSTPNIIIKDQPVRTIIDSDIINAQISSSAQNALEKTYPLESTIHETRRTIKTDSGDNIGEANILTSVPSHSSDSVFSLPTSVTSLETSVSSEDSEDLLLLELTNLLWNEPSLKNILFETASIQNIDIKRFRQNFHQLLRQFASDLRSEAEGIEQRRAANFVNRKSGAVAATISERMLGKLGVPHTEKEENSEEEKDLEGEELSKNDEINKLTTVKDFLLSSDAFVKLQQSLHAFVHPTIQPKLADLVDNTVGGMIEFDKHEWSPRLQAIVHDLQSISPDLVRFSVSTTSTWDNRLKVKAELWTGENWNWWPLRPAKHSLMADQTRISWTCTCGDEIWCDVPAKFARGLEGLLRRNASDISSGTDVQTSSQLSSQDEASGYTQAQMPTRSSLPGQNVSEQPQNALTQRRLNPQMQQLLSQRVLVVVHSGGEFHLAQIALHGTSTVAFFQMFRAEYFRLRGVFRRYFSVWQYSHCDFYQFEKFDELDFAPTKDNDFPDVGNSDYLYQPKPMNRIPPISKHEFEKRFHACINHSILHRYLWKCSKNCRCNILKGKAHSNELLDLLPKKLSVLDERSEKREPFWGLYARQKVMFWRVLVYNFICVTPLIWFSFMWMFAWGHGGDLQNATVPLMFMLGLLTFFWGSFFASCGLTDVRERA